MIYTTQKKVLKEDYSFYKELYTKYKADFPNLSRDEFINLIADLRNTKDKEYLSVYNLDDYQSNKIIEIIKTEFGGV